MKINDYFVSASSDSTTDSFIKTEFDQCIQLIDVLKISTEIVFDDGLCTYNGADRSANYLLNNLGFEGFNESWIEWYCGIISKNGRSPNRRIFPNGKPLSFHECMKVLETMPRSHVQNTIIIMNKLNIMANNRCIEDITSAVVKFAVLSKLTNFFKDSNTLKTIEYHLCKILNGE